MRDPAASPTVPPRRLGRRGLEIDTGGLGCRAIGGPAWCGLLRQADTAEIERVEAAAE